MVYTREIFSPKPNHPTIQIQKKVDIVLEIHKGQFQFLHMMSFHLFTATYQY